MKLAIRIFALTVVLAGAAAASVSASKPVPSHQAVSAGMPGPVCTPGMPTCPK
jgi:hypothetical protein